MSGLLSVFVGIIASICITMVALFSIVYFSDNPQFIHGVDPDILNTYKVTMRRVWSAFAISLLLVGVPFCTYTGRLCRHYAHRRPTRVVVWGSISGAITMWLHAMLWFAANRPVVDAGFAMIWTITVCPTILFIFADSAMVQYAFDGKYCTCY